MNLLVATARRRVSPATPNCASQNAAGGMLFLHPRFGGKEVSSVRIRHEYRECLQLAASNHRGKSSGTLWWRNLRVPDNGRFQTACYYLSPCSRVIGNSKS